ncbi:MAG: prepilin-type N-terminal cleavage/methylation domain-containing protein [Bacilli bacterium]|nr:prepilin-type N-terminal cleavage/methylation domain-containing protein [Bacilli bacterium]
MNNKGFTLIELIAVIAIVAAVSVLLGTNFLKLTGNVDAYEDKVIAKGIAEAAYIYYGSPSDTDGQDPVSAYDLIKAGFISSDQGLLKDYGLSDLIRFCAEVKIENYEKKVIVKKSTGSGSNETCSGNEIPYNE